MGMSAGGGDDDLKSEINVTPLVDVMLVLLIIIMITAPMMNTGVSLELPQIAAQNIEDPEGKLVLSIGKDSHIFLGGTQVTWTMNGDMGANPLYRWMGLFMDKMVGPDFDAGLANLKALAEKA